MALSGHGLSQGGPLVVLSPTTESISLPTDTVQLAISYRKKETAEERTVVIAVGERLAVRSWDHERIKGVVTKMSAETIEIDGRLIQLKEVRYIYGKRRIKAGHFAAVAGGVGLGITSSILLRQGEEELDPRVRVAGNAAVPFLFTTVVGVSVYGAMITVSSVTSLFNARRFDCSRYIKELTYRTAADVSALETIRAIDKE